MTQSSTQALTTDTNTYDIVVLGGGITGAAIARDAALRGLKVALFEKGDWGSGTSSKSSKLIHGGLRYLEHGEVGLVFESVSERAVQRKVAPHLVRPLPFLVPIYKGAKPGLELMNVGLWIYDTLALFRAPKMHRVFRGKKATDLEPALKDDDLKGAIEYYDCVTDDARLVLENIIDAEEAGAECHSYTPVTSFDRGDDGRVRGVNVRDSFTGEQRYVGCRALIVAAGAWTDEVANQTGVAGKNDLLRRTKGVHIVFPREKLPLRRAVTLISQVDGRVMFAIPWKDRTVLGTTDTDFEGTADDCHASAEDVQYLCDGANQYFPEANFRPDEVIGTWSGLRPLINQEAENEGAVSREHEVFVRGDGVTIIAGGKLTTYRRMGKECVKKTLKWLEGAFPDVYEQRKLHRPRTRKRPLPGARGLAKRSMTGVNALAKNFHAMYADRGIDKKIAVHLAHTYGTRVKEIGALVDDHAALAERMQDDLPYIWAEVDFAARFDRARTVADVLGRRIPLEYVGLDQGLDITDRVAARLGELLGYSAERVAAQANEYRAIVANSRQYRDDELAKAAG